MIFFEEGDVPKIGDTLAIITSEGEEDKEEIVEDNKKIEFETVATDSLQLDLDEETVNDNSPNSIGSRTASGKFLSPLVRNIATKENINIDELDTIEGSGENGRISKADILDYIEKRETGDLGLIVKKKADDPVASTEQLVKSNPIPAIKAETIDDSDVEIIEMGRMRKLIADHMLASVKTSPHVTSFVEVGITNLVEWRNKNKDA